MKRIAAAVGILGMLALAGCGATTTFGHDPAADSSPSQGVFTSQPVPAPVSTSAALTSTCAVGYENVQPQTGVNGDGSTYQEAGPYGGFPGRPGETLISGSWYAAVQAMQVTLANNSGATGDVGGIAV